MPKRFYRFKLLLDENLPPRDRFLRINNRFTLLHIVHDLKKEGIRDIQVYKIAVEKEAIIVTFNYKHFKAMNLAKVTGVIGISNNLSIEQIDIKLSALLTRSKKGDIYGKAVYIS